MATLFDVDELDEEQGKRSIIVSNIPENVTYKDIAIHFQKKRNGGGELDVDSVRYLDPTDSSVVIVTFEQPETVETAINREQIIDGVQVIVQRYPASAIIIPEFQSQKHEDGQYQTQGKKQKEDKTQECHICYGKLQRPKTLPGCKHTFCTSCLDKALQISMWCPLCKSPLSDSTSSSQVAGGSITQVTQGSMFGHDGRDRQARGIDSNQGAMSTHGRLSSAKPDGTMTYRREHFSLPGYEDCGTILIQYSLRGGNQGPEHPNPGQPYDSTSRGAYLPDNKQGAKVFKLLQAAFDRGLVFKIGRSMTSGQDNQIVWADIPHKTCISGGPSNYGYPDPTYLTEVQHILQAMLGHDSSDLNNY